MVSVGRIMALPTQSKGDTVVVLLWFLSEPERMIWLWICPNQVSRHSFNSFEQKWIIRQVTRTNVFYDGLVFWGKVRLRAVDHYATGIFLAPRSVLLNTRLNGVGVIMMQFAGSRVVYLPSVIFIAASSRLTCIS